MILNIVLSILDAYEILNFRKVDKVEKYGTISSPCNAIKFDNSTSLLMTRTWKILLLKIQKWQIAGISAGEIAMTLCRTICIKYEALISNRFIQWATWRWLIHFEIRIHDRWHSKDTNLDINPKKLRPGSTKTRKRSDDEL